MPRAPTCEPLPRESPNLLPPNFFITQQMPLASVFRLTIQCAAMRRLGYQRYILTARIRRTGESSRRICAIRRTWSVEHCLCQGYAAKDPGPKQLWLSKTHKQLTGNVVDVRIAPTAIQALAAHSMAELPDLEDLAPTTDVARLQKPEQVYAARRRNISSSGAHPPATAGGLAGGSSSSAGAVLLPGLASIWVKTFGCSHNTSDTEYMMGQLQEHGCVGAGATQGRCSAADPDGALSLPLSGLYHSYTLVRDDQQEAADLWLINSCTVKARGAYYALQVFFLSRNP